MKSQKDHDHRPGWRASGHHPALGTERASAHPATPDGHGSSRPPALHDPAHIGPSWSSFVTGMNPGKTGIYDFLYRREGTYSFPPVNASLRGGTTMWRYLSDAGYRVGVLNLPMSYPVEQVNGFMVSGWMTPYTATDYIHPPELAARTGTGGWRLSHLSHRDLHRGPPGEFLKASTNCWRCAPARRSTWPRTSPGTCS